MDPILAAIESFMKSVDERVAAAEVAIRASLLRELKGMIPEPAAPIPGLQGQPGQPGEKGKDGRGIIKAAIRDGMLVLTLSDGVELGADLKIPDPIPGERGFKGEPGELGKAGRDGIDGKDGANGINGKDGAPGVNGKDGVDGIDGKDGKDGVHGKDGANGINGKDGAPGMDGEDGEDGEDGDHGINGKDGRGIDDLTILEGTLFVKLTDGNKLALGRVVGDRGPEGVPGPAGQSVRGEKGEKGDPARDGAPGAKGDPGRDGKDGTPGRDGKDGITREDMKSAAQEAVVKVFNEAEIEENTLKIADNVLRFPHMQIYKNTWKEGVTYEPGQTVTWAGSGWHCNKTTTRKPGGDEGDWTLFVKKGADAPRRV